MDKIEDAIADIRAGKMVVVVDDEDRENEGDLVMAAEKADKKTINFMIKEARGLVCTPVEKEILDRLDLPMMVEKNTETHSTAFTVSVDHVDVTTGISAQERAYTIQKLVEEDSKPEDFMRPGHIFPLGAKKGGVLRRAGHTEAAVDLAKLAGLKPAGVICEIIKEDGEMARMPELEKFAEKHDLKLISIEDLIKYRKKEDKLVHKAAEAELPTEFGKFKIKVFTSEIDNKEHIAIIKGDVEGNQNVESGEYLLTGTIEVKEPYRRLGIYTSIIYAGYEYAKSIGLKGIASLQFDIDSGDFERTPAATSVWENLLKVDTKVAKMTSDPWGDGLEVDYLMN